MDKDSVLDKIRKLLRLQYSAEKVGNAGEAFQAAKMVRKLLFEYNLSMNDVNDGDSKGSQSVTESDGISMSDQYSIHWKRRLLGIICQYNLCELLYQPRYKKMRIVGTEANIIICREFYQYLLKVFQRLSMERLDEAQNEAIRYGRIMLPVQKKEYMRSYLEGIPDGLRDNYESHRPTAEETGIVVCHKDMIKSYYRQKDYKIGKGRNSRIEVIGSAYDVGFSDGRNVSLDRQLRQEKTSRTAIA